MSHNLNFKFVLCFPYRRAMHSNQFEINQNAGVMRFAFRMRVCQIHDDLNIKIVWRTVAALQTMLSKTIRFNSMRCYADRLIDDGAGSV